MTDREQPVLTSTGPKGICRDYETCPTQDVGFCASCVTAAINAAEALALERATTHLQEAADDWRSTGHDLIARKLTDEIPHIRALAPSPNALAEHDAKVRAEAEAPLLELLRWVHETLWEINPSNYDHDDVCKLNAASVEVILGIAPMLGETHGKSPEWWAAREQAND